MEYSDADAPTAGGGGKRDKAKIGATRCHSGMLVGSFTCRNLVFHGAQTFPRSSKLNPVAYRSVPYISSSLGHCTVKQYPFSESNYDP